VNPRRVMLLVAALFAAFVMMAPVEAAAQRRVFRRAPARVAFYHSPYFYDPLWLGFSGYQFPRYPYPPYAHGYYDASAELRVQVKPTEAEVYVDGYLTGTVDDFDGVFQRLRMPLGEHEVTIYAQGYRSISHRMLFRPFESYTIKDTMQPLAAGAPAEPRPAPSAAPRSQRPLPPGRLPVERPDDRRPDRDIDPGAERFGTIAIRVQPEDAEVLIDGERWESPAGERVVVQLLEGEHRVEIRKTGFRTYTSAVRVRSGETVSLNVSLE
jgi:hypothetical protein